MKKDNWSEGDVYQSPTLREQIEDRRPEHFRLGMTDHVPKATNPNQGRLF